ncbi:hypothetical protein [Pedobacter ureilyticus]|nr:hypothetical protein [Pedobacter helvus]
MQMLNFKRPIFIMLALLFTTLTISSCSKDDNETNNEGGVHLKAKIGSKDHNFNNVRARWIEGGAYLEITGITTSGEALSITVLNNAGKRVPVGKYILDDATDFDILSTYHTMENGIQKNFSASTETVWNDAFELEITKQNNTYVEGKFSGTLVIGAGLTTLQTITVENGSFSTPIGNE